MSRPPQAQASNSDVFRDDLLNRKSAVEDYSRVLRRVESPCVLALDAGWGAGKTTLIKFWEAHLKNEGFEVMVFSAWESELCTDPLFSLISKLASTPQKSGVPARRMRPLADALMRVLGAGLAGVVRNATPTDLQPIIAELCKVYGGGQNKPQSKHPRLQSHDDLQDTVKKFKDGLTEHAGRISRSCDGRPFVVFIDELDRCRPTHAIELLECAKHLFRVENLIVVLAVNRSELANSLRAIYGERFNADRYLRRIFDHELLLPRASDDRKNFVMVWYEKTGIQSRLEKSSDPRGREDNKISREILVEFFAPSSLELRDIEQTLSHLNLVFAAVPENAADYALVTVVVVVLRTLYPDRYKKFKDHEMTGSKLFEEIWPLQLRASIPRPIQVVFAATLVTIADNHETLVDLDGDYVGPSSLREKFDHEIRQHEDQYMVPFAKDAISRADKIAEAYQGGIAVDTVIRRVELLAPRL